MQRLKPPNVPANKKYFKKESYFFMMIEATEKVTIVHHCTLCQQKYSRSQSLRNHYLNAHEGTHLNNLCNISNEIYNVYSYDKKPGFS